MVEKRKGNCNQAPEGTLSDRYSITFSYEHLPMRKLRISQVL